MHLKAKRSYTVHFFKRVNSENILRRINLTIQRHYLSLCWIDITSTPTFFKVLVFSAVSYIFQSVSCILIRVQQTGFCWMTDTSNLEQLIHSKAMSDVYAYITHANNWAQTAFIYQDTYRKLWYRENVTTTRGFLFSTYLTVIRTRRPQKCLLLHFEPNLFRMPAQHFFLQQFRVCTVTQGTDSLFLQSHSIIFESTNSI